MTYQDDFTLSEQLLEQITAQGTEFLPELIRVLVNAAMKAERQQHLGAAPYQRSSERQGHANGFKPKTLNNRMCKITFDIRFLSARARKGAAQRASLDPDAGRNVRTRCIHPQGLSDCGAVVRGEYLVNAG